MSLLTLSIGVGLAVALLFSELFGLAAGGVVVPGYIALFLTPPLSLAYTLVASFVPFALVRSSSSLFVLYGRRRTAMMILVGYLVGMASALLPGRVFAASPLSLSYGGFAMGLQSFTLRKLPLEAMLDAVQRLGLRHVELIPETKLLFYEFGSHFPVGEDATAIAQVRARKTLPTPGASPASSLSQGLVRP